MTSTSTPMIVPSTSMGPVSNVKSSSHESTKTVVSPSKEGSRLQPTYAAAISSLSRTSLSFASRPNERVR
jgi:hypothetical protein